MAVDQANEYEQLGWKIRKLYTSDQLAAAILKATKPLEDSLAIVKKDRADLYMETLTLWNQLAKAEQRVSEAFIECMVDLKQRDYAFTGTTVIGIEKCETAIRSGEWRKFST